MLAFWIFILSILLMMLFLVAHEASNQDWTIEAIRLWWTMTMLVAILLLMSLGLWTYE